MLQSMISGEISTWESPIGSPLDTNAPRASERQQPATMDSWMTVLDVALLILSAEFEAAGACVPERFAPRALASAALSVRRWKDEGRIFAVGDLYPRYQFDIHGQPHAPVEKAISAFGRGNIAKIGNWFSSPNVILQGRRPRDLLSCDPYAVLGALQGH